jgi:hypothetical protein
MNAADNATALSRLHIMINPELKKTLMARAGRRQVGDFVRRVLAREFGLAEMARSARGGSASGGQRRRAAMLAEVERAQ